MKKQYFKASKGRNPGTHPYTIDDMKKAGWCHRKKIFVAVIPDWEQGMSDWRVEITMNGVTHLDPKTYNGYNAQTKMYEYYKYYYDKSNI